MNNQQSRHFWELLLFLLIGLVAWQAPTTVAANYDNAIKNVPAGINVNAAGLMALGQLVKSTDGGNNIPSMAWDQNLQNIVKITQASKGITQQQVGTVWSTGADFDYTKPQTLKLWLYLGYQANAVGNNNTSDGLAFVLQNDPRGLSASAKTNYGIFGGETLGVWGTDNSSKGNLNTATSNAIQKSWALEFDTYLNNLTGAAAVVSTPSLGSNSQILSSFDDEQSGPHIMANYPAETSTYRSKSTGLLLNVKHYLTQNHPLLTTINSNLADNQWHHLVLNWSPDYEGATQGTMVMTLNDRNPDGSSNTANEIVQSYALDTTKIAATTNAGKVRWGITGATSNYAATDNLVVVDALPNFKFGTGQASVKLTDSTNQQPISNDQTVANGQSLTTTYQVKYDDQQTNVDWQNIVAKIPLPEQTTWQSGTVAYQNGTTETLTSVDLTNNQLLTKTLAQPLSASNSEATITLKLATNNVTTPTNVPNTTATFTSEQYVAAATTPSYTLLPVKQLKISNTQISAQVVTTTFPTITGQFTYQDADGNTIPNVTNQDFTLHYTLNGSTTGSFPVSDTSTTAQQFVINDTKIPASALQLGTNTLVYDLTDATGNHSNPVTATITRVSGTLALTNVPSEINFATANLTGKPQTVGRSNAEVTINVLDGRPTLQQSWQLNMAATPLTKLNSPTPVTLPGQLVYKSATATAIPLNISFQKITGKQTTSYNEVTPITWTAQTGLFLQVASNALAGKYQGTVDWELTDAP